MAKFDSPFALSRGARLAPHEVDALNAMIEADKRRREGKCGAEVERRYRHAVGGRIVEVRK